MSLSFRCENRRGLFRSKRSGGGGGGGGMMLAAAEEEEEGEIFGGGVGRGGGTAPIYRSDRLPRIMRSGILQFFL